MYRPEDWKNPYALPKGVTNPFDSRVSHSNAYEAGADAMLIHIIAFAKKSAPGSKLLEVLLRA